MTVAELLAELRELDAHIELDGDRLRLNAPAGVLTPEHRTELQQRKAEIVEFLRAASHLAQQQRAIVPLQPNGTRSPIFAVAGHNGDVFCYRALAQHIGADQPLFGLQPPGLEEGSEPLTSVEDLAGYFAGQIRQAQPQGPLTIAGFCAGGTVAFELARQLAESGANVKNLVLFGAPYCMAYRTGQQIIARTLQVARRAFVHAHALLTLRSDDRRRYFEARMQGLRAITAPPSTDPVMIRRNAVENATLAAVRRYSPAPLDGWIDLMLPCASWKHSLDAPLRWGRLASRSAEFVGPDDCNGDTMLLPEHAATFAAFVAAAQDAHSRRINT